MAIQFGSFRKLENEDLAAKLRKWKFLGDQPQALLYSSLSNDWTECLLKNRNIRRLGFENSHFYLTDFNHIAFVGLLKLAPNWIRTNIFEM